MTVAAPGLPNDPPNPCHLARTAGLVVAVAVGDAAEAWRNRPEASAVVRKLSWGVLHMLSLSILLGIHLGHAEEAFVVDAAAAAAAAAWGSCLQRMHPEHLVVSTSEMQVHQQKLLAGRSCLDKPAHYPERRVVVAAWHTGEAAVDVAVACSGVRVYFDSGDLAMACFAVAFAADPGIEVADTPAKGSADGELAEMAMACCHKPAQRVMVQALQGDMVNEQPVASADS